MANDTKTSTTGNRTSTGGSNPGGASTGGAGTVTITTGKNPPKSINISNVGGRTDARNPGGMDPADKRNSVNKRLVNEILGPKDGSEKKEPMGNALHAISEELVDAVHAKDAAGVADALRAAYAECGTASPEPTED